MGKLFGCACMLWRKIMGLFSTTKRKIIALVLAGAIVIAAGAVVGVVIFKRKEQAADLKARGYCEMMLWGGGEYYVVTGIEDDANRSNIVIPNTYKGKPVKEIWDRAFSGNETLISIVIPDNIEEIGLDAFSRCKALERVEFGEGLKQINSSAFWGCDSLTGIAIPNSVTYIGRNAFDGCDSLRRVVIGDGVTEIGVGAFSGCSALTSVVIGESVTSMGCFVFGGCDCLTTIEFKDTTTWYKTADVTEWNKKTGGEELDVTDSSTNIRHYRNQNSYYWYKL